MTPEQTSRQQIDRQLEKAGWSVQDYRQMNITAGLGVAVREFPRTTGNADYMLYADAKAIGVVEAKPKGRTLTGRRNAVGEVPRRPPDNSSALSAWQSPLAETDLDRGNLRGPLAVVRL
jgi:type I restriction enzyme R subunit